MILRHFITLRFPAVLGIYEIIGIPSVLIAIELRGLAVAVIVEVVFPELHVALPHIKSCVFVPLAKLKYGKPFAPTCKSVHWPPEVTTALVFVTDVHSLSLHFQKSIEVPLPWVIIGKPFAPIATEEGTELPLDIVSKVLIVFPELQAILPQ